MSDRAWLNLPEVAPPRGQPLGLYLSLGECLELDEDASPSCGSTSFEAERHTLERRSHEQPVVWERFEQIKTIVMVSMRFMRRFDAVISIRQTSPVGLGLEGNSTRIAYLVSY